MTYWEVKSLAEQLLAQHGLIEKGWKVAFHSGRRSIGYCCYQRKEIVLSICFLNRADVHVKNTILHEIAHALTQGAGHSQVWKDVAINIGCDGQVCENAMNIRQQEVAFRVNQRMDK